MWNPLQFHVHHPSEHQINGVLFDAEMHMVHLPSAGATDAQKKASFATAITFIFDREKADAKLKSDTAVAATVKDFFNAWIDRNDGDDLDLGDKVDKLTKLINWNDRWTYEGSLTTPPCTKLAYFNVPRQVLPIDQETFDKIKSAMTRGNNKYFNGQADQWTVNTRPVQPINTQNVHRVVDADEPKKTDNTMQSLFIAFLILFIFALIGFIVACVMLCKAQGSKDVSEGSEMVGQASVEANVAKENNA